MLLLGTFIPASKLIWRLHDSPNPSGYLSLTPYLCTMPNSFFKDDNDKGVQVIMGKLGASGQTCSEINNIYEIRYQELVPPFFLINSLTWQCRAQIEEEYGEKLLKLSQMMVGEAEEGTLGESISHIPTALETTARAHVDLAQQLRQDLHTTLNGFLKEHGEKKKAVRMLFTVLATN